MATITHPPRAIDLPAGVGVSARLPHVPELTAAAAAVSFLELLADNHLAPGSPAHDAALALASRYPVVVHCVGMSLGSPDPLDVDYLRRVRTFCEAVGALAVSDHCAFTRFHGREYHDLLPLPHTRETLAHLVDRIDAAHQILGRTLSLENGSRYLPQPADAMPECEFFTELCARSGCRLLLDINNACVNQENHGESAAALVFGVPPESISYVHVAGYVREGAWCLDTHGDRVSADVLGLLKDLLMLRPLTPVCLEWDRDLPPLAGLLAEAARIGQTLGMATDRHAT